MDTVERDRLGKVMFFFFNLNEKTKLVIKQSYNLCNTSITSLLTLKESLFT